MCKKYRSLIGEKYAIFDIKKCEFQNYYSKYEKAPVGFKLICNSLGQTLTTWLHSIKSYSKKSINASNVQ